MYCTAEAVALGSEQVTLGAAHLLLSTWAEQVDQDNDDWHHHHHHAHPTVPQNRGG